MVGPSVTVTAEPSDWCFPVRQRGRDTVRCVQFFSSTKVSIDGDHANNKIQPPFFFGYNIDEEIRLLLDDRAPLYNAEDPDSDSVKKTGGSIVTVAVVKDEEVADKRPNVRKAQIVRVFQIAHFSELMRYSCR